MIQFLKKIVYAWQHRDQLGDNNQSRELAQFLPAALEIQATPPNPLARWLACLLMGLVVTGLLWAILGKVNIVASAEGKIIPSSRVKQIQPLEKAMVKAILVKEGQAVQAGDSLVELDNTSSIADQSRLENELVTLSDNLVVSDTFISWLTLPLSEQQNITVQNTLILNKLEKPLYQQLLWQHWQNYWSQQTALSHAKQKNQAEQAATQAQIEKLQQTLPIVRQRTQKIKSLYDKKHASEDQYLTAMQERIEQTQNLKTEQQRLKQLQAAEQEIDQQIQGYNAQTQAQHLSQITQYQQQIEALQKELTKIRDINAKHLLTAPVSGEVKSLAVNTVGGVVTEAQELMLIVPHEEQLEVEVFLENKDIGFVYEGMPAEIKIHTFPFTKYGIIDGEVLTISNDATVDEQRGLIYSMRLLMKQDSILVDGKEVKLIPGMAVTAELQTGYRRIIEFFLAPLLRYQQEGLRER